MAYHFDATGATYESVNLRNVFQIIKLGEKEMGEKIKRKGIEVRVVFSELGNYIELPPRFWWNIAVEILELKKQRTKLVKKKGVDMSFTSLELKTKKWIDTLAKLPETAMGCQIVDITLKNGQIMRNIAVSGSTFIFLPVKYKNVTEKDFVKIEMF